MVLTPPPAYASSTVLLHDKPIQKSVQEVSSTTVVSLIKKYADQFGVNEQILNKVVNCESGYDPTIVGDHGLAYGPAQFHESTFDNFAKQYGVELDYKNPEDQIELMAWAFKQGNEYMNDWTCAVTLGYATR